MRTRIRTVVRFIFWYTIAILVTIGLTTVARWVRDGYDLPPCPVVLHDDHTWDSTNGEIVNVYKCKAPNNVYLQEWGTWY